MEGYNNKPEMLFVLRMNAEGNDVFIEEYELSEFPKLEEWFNKPKGIFDYNAIFEEMKLVGQCLGAERIVNYDRRKFVLELELKDMKQSLKDYTESVLKVEKALENIGVEDFKHAKSMEKLNWCSFSDLFYIYGKPFLKLEYRLGHRLRLDSGIVGYNIPCWKIEFLHRGDLSVHKRNDSVEGQKTFDEWMQVIAQIPEDADLKKKIICELIHTIYGFEIQITDILYDPASKCFVLKEEVEQNMLKDIKPERAAEPDEIAKYTTLDTLVAVLQSGKMRMNSIVSMNDKTEIGFLEEYIRNYKEDFDKYLFADKEFITSFTTRIDDLDMWRLYGDNARGVCMVFERINKDSDELFNISYIAEKSDVLEKIAKLQDALKDNSIRFRMNLLKKYQHFLKLSDYSSESECRLMVNSEKTDGWFINRDNGILTPYIEKKLVREVEEDNIYPFRLSGIILGPASRELTANMMQVLYMAAQCQYSLFVKQSKITSYR
jgi:hypothetical protein